MEEGEAAVGGGRGKEPAGGRAQAQKGAAHAAAAAAATTAASNQTSTKGLGLRVAAAAPQDAALAATVGGNTVEVTGFNLKRQEFDPEYDNDAEVPLAELEFFESVCGRGAVSLFPSAPCGLLLSSAREREGEVCC